MFNWCSSYFESKFCAKYWHERKFYLIFYLRFPFFNSNRYVIISIVKLSNKICLFLLTSHSIIWSLNHTKHKSSYFYTYQVSIQLKNVLIWDEPDNWWCGIICCLYAVWHLPSIVIIISTTRTFIEEMKKLQTWNSRKSYK